MTNALLDGETGVYTRTAWDHLADAEISRARRYGDPLTLALVKLHPSPSMREEDFPELFIKLTRLLTERCRREDMIGRFADDIAAVLAVTLNGDSNGLVNALEEACEDFPVTIIGIQHRLTRPFAASVRDAESALSLANRAFKHASA